MTIVVAASGQDGDPASPRTGATCRELWDPASPWPAGRKWIWAIVATMVLIAQGPSFLTQLQVTWNVGNDYYQDWTSARNVLDGLPAYLPLSESLSRHFPTVDGGRPPPALLPWNAHPPTSVLAILPLGIVDYPQSGTLWNVLSLIALGASLGLIARGLNFPVPVWSLLPIVALGLICNPIREQISQGQWNAILLLLLTLAWVSERRGRDSWAGFLIGAAVVLKFFPALFLVDFAIRRRWRALIAGCGSVIGLSLVTIAALGLDAYRDYYHRVLPTLKVFQSEWDNASLLAFWTKNFAEGASHYGLFIEPVIHAPVLARAGIVLSYATVLATTFFVFNPFRYCHEHERASGDLRYSLTMVTMLLLTPICWDHYLLLLAVPLALIWRSLNRSTLQRLAFLFLVAAVWVGPHDMWRMGGVDIYAGWPDFQNVPPKTYIIHRHFFLPVFLTIHFYALLASYVWLAILARGECVAT